MSELIRKTVNFDAMSTVPSQCIMRVCRQFHAILAACFADGSALPVWAWLCTSFVQVGTKTFQNVLLVRRWRWMRLAHTCALTTAEHSVTCGSLPCGKSRNATAWTVSLLSSDDHMSWDTLFLLRFVGRPLLGLSCSRTPKM